MSIKLPEQLSHVVVSVLALTAASAYAEKKYGPGASDTEKDIEVAALLPGIRINTSPTDFYPIEQVQLMRFDGKSWVRFGEMMSR